MPAETTTTWYRAAFGQILPVDVVKVSKKTVEVVRFGGGTRREYREGQYWATLPTVEAAKAWLVARARARVEEVGRELAYREGELRKMEGL